MTAPTTAQVLAGIRATRERDEDARWVRLMGKEVER